MKLIIKLTVFILVSGIVICSSYALSNAFDGVSLTPVTFPLANIATADTTKVEHPTFPIKKTSQNTPEDVNKKYPMDAPKPENAKTVVEYDPKAESYVIRSFIGNMEVSTPILMTPKEYLSYSEKSELQKYWQEKNNKSEKNFEDKFSLTDMKFNLGPADKLFGPGGLQIKTQGSTELVFGYKYNKINNPTLTERMRSVGSFDFDEKIQLNVSGSIGDKMNLKLNYNTESSFDFDQKLINLNYRGKEDDIIKSIDAGNVSMPLNSSLITGSTSLFGIKTELQFGKLNITALASQQQSQAQTVSTKGGVQTTKFEINASNYDENRHYFLSQFFRENYENAMASLPYISSGISINRIEVWVTNKRASFDQPRNIIAFMDLGERDKIDNPYWNITSQERNPQNSSNDLYSKMLHLSGIRNIQTTNKTLSDYFQTIPGINGGEDYEKIESARKLDGSEYTLNKTLGYISLRTMLNPDEILAVAYDYTYKGQTYQVGELSTDNIKAPEALIVKLLKSTSNSPLLKTWDLMMKNIYSIGATNVQQEKFRLNVTYRNDSIGTDVQYLTKGDIKNKVLLRVLNLDNLNSKNEQNPDGIFDYVSGYTIIPYTGQIIFPVLEPFGSYLRKKINNNAIADKIVFQELYDSTLVVAQQYTDKNKFKLVGEYKGSSGTEIRLGAMNVPRGSVRVTAGGVNLTENQDYTVDYLMGTVTIINQSIIQSGSNIDVKLENQSNFNLQRKTMVGTHLEYNFNKDFSLGGTIMHLSELPLTTKVNTGNEPISNTIWGMNTAWKSESQWLTNMVNKLPFVNATRPSNIAFNAEVAQLIPGHSKSIGKQGLAYIDDFEATQVKIDIHYPVNWYLSSTPYDPKGGFFPEAGLSNDIKYGKNRALLSWYYVDPLFNEQRTTTPSYIKNNPDAQSNHLTRKVLEQEVFPNKSLSATTPPNLTVMNLTYYPNERGPYNLDVDGLNPDGTLSNPKSRWGGIMRKLDVTDFETANIEYIEFWMMDPFINDASQINKGGELYFNLGDISEDILRDGKKSFENGLPINGDLTQTETTVWGRVPTIQSTVNAFSGDRKYQDVGMDGLLNSDEYIFPTYKNYVDQVKSKITDPQVIAEMQNDPFSILNDPAGDNYHYYRGTDYDKDKLDIISRYKHYNGTEGNSPDANQTKESYPTAATSLPDREDVNNDNTLNEYEKYFQYRVSIDRDSMKIGSNHITDIVTSSVKLENKKTEMVKWYQFKIPVREYLTKIGSILNFKSIRFIRMFLTNFDRQTTLRFATLDLVKGEWRSYNQSLHLPTTPIISTPKLEVQSVNIEENASKTPVNYVLPPGITREIDPSQPSLLQLNEQSMVLRVKDLSPGDAKGVYKNTSYDMRRYKHLQMFVHAEKLPDDIKTLSDHELTCFIRLGSDLTNNYYEYEIPLRLTPPGNYEGETTGGREKVWIPDNMFDFAFEKLINAKLKRNYDRQNGTANVSNSVPYVVYDGDKNKITVVGNPSISDVENMMIGIRNASTTVKSGEIWVNELRMSQFDESGGVAALANLAINLSDIGMVNFSGRLETAGYGGLESTINTRRQDNLYQMNFATSVNVGRFLPEFTKLSIPAYYSYTNETLSPKYNPLDEDVDLNDALRNAKNASQRDTIKMLSQTVSTTKSFNIAGAKVNIKSKTPQIYDPANITLNYAYIRTSQTSPEIETNVDKTVKGGLNYSYSFASKPVEPFKNIKLFNTPYFKWIKDFNFFYLPNLISFNTDMSRHFSQIKVRDLSAPLSSNTLSDLNYSHEFLWNKDFEIKYDLTKSIKLGLHTAMNSNIYEGNAMPEFGKDYYEKWRDTVWSSIKKLGTPYTYQQVFTASWTLPFDKIPLLDWVTGNINYNSTYTWNKMAQLRKSNADLGNIATSQGAWQADGQLNFENLYNKIGYLKKLNRSNNDRTNKKKDNTQTENKTFKQSYKLIKGKLLTVKHNLSSTDIKFTALGKNGTPIPLKYAVRTPSIIELTPTVNADSVTIIIEDQPANNSVLKQAIDFTVRALMFVRRASISFHKTNNMVLPGIKTTPGFMGQEKGTDGLYSPGYPFVFGFFNDSYLEKAKSHDWLNQNDTIVNPATIARITDLTINATLEPLKGLKIDLNAKRYEAKNSSTQYTFDDMPRTYNGNFEITYIAIGTAFKKFGSANQNFNSPLFNKLLANRQIVADRLNHNLQNTQYPNSGFLRNNGLGTKYFDETRGKYDLNSAQVLIPSFLAAYTGRDVNKISSNPFLSILNMLPNWRIFYDELSNIEWVKNHFKSVSLTHAYTCVYSIGSYTSYSTWVGSNDVNGFVSDVQDETKALPSWAWDISSVNINEQFAPLIGLNVTLKNSVSTKLEYRKQRTLSLNLSSTQLIETASNEMVIGAGYTLKDFDVILRLKSDKQSKIKNDLKLSADISYKDMKTLLRKIDNNTTQPTNGNKVVSVKVMADYVFSSRVNVQLFYDTQSSTPLISSSYPVTSTNFGLNFKFMLTR